MTRYVISILVLLCAACAGSAADFANIYSQSTTGIVTLPGDLHITGTVSQANGLPTTVPLAVDTISTAHTITTSNRVLIVDTTSGDVTITLPPAADVDGLTFQVKKLVTANSITLDGDGAETIDGSASWTWYERWMSVTVISDGTSWYRI